MFGITGGKSLEMGQYLGLGVNVTLPGLLFTNAHLDLKYAFWEGFVGYRLINCQRASLSLYAGARYTYYSGALRVSNNKDPRFPDSVGDWEFQTVCLWKAPSVGPIRSLGWGQGARLEADLALGERRRWRF